MALKSKTRWGRSPAVTSSPGPEPEPRPGSPSVPFTQPGPDRPRSAQVLRRRFAIGRTRTGGWWVTLVAAAVVLLLLLIFVLQNGSKVAVSFLGAQATLPLGIALLLAATAGVLIVAIPGTGRILQLRHLARRQARRPEPAPPPAGPSGQPTERAATEPAAGQAADDAPSSADAHEASRQGHRAP